MCEVWHFRPAEFAPFSGVAGHAERLAGCALFIGRAHLGGQRRAGIWHEAAQIGAFARQGLRIRAEASSRKGRAAQQGASQDQALLFAAAGLAMPFARRSRSFAPHGQTLNRFPGERASAHAAAFVRILLSFE